MRRGMLPTVGGERSAGAAMATQSPNDGDGAAGRLNPYIELLSEFVEKGMDPATFDRTFVATYVADETVWTDEEASILDRLLGAAENFDADPELRAELDVAADAEELRQ